jgi:signal transduction histidine kinase
MTLTPNGYVLLGMTALVGVLTAMVTFAVLRFVSLSRESRRPRSAADPAMLAGALQEAVARLKAQERATAARAEASERMSGEIIASLTAGLLVVGLNGEVRILNPAGRRMLRVPDAAPLDSYRRLLEEPVLSSIIDECLATRGAILRRTVELPGQRGGASHIGVTVSPMMDAEGELHGAICLFTDLTAVKELEEQLRLKESLATVGELTAGIAHEFRNGLATIHGYSKLIDVTALPESYRSYILGIRAETDSLSAVVTNFLNFARPAQLTLGHVDLGSICERAVEEWRAEARGQGGDVVVRGTFGVIEGDEVLLRQAFSNLLRNAVEACTGAGVVPMIVIRSEVDAARGVQAVTVEDNGPGIPVELRDRVFQPFYTSKRSGTGLGLALVLKIVVLHNGRIVVGQAELGGASLQVSLPTVV